MLPFAFEVNNFFRFAKLFVLPTKVVFLNRGEWLCSPLLSRSTTFFAFAKLSVSPEPSRFPQSRGVVMLPSASLVNRFLHPSKNSLAQRVNSVSRGMQYTQAASLCQRKTHFFVILTPETPPSLILHPLPHRLQHPKRDALLPVPLFTY